MLHTSVQGNDTTLSRDGAAAVELPSNQYNLFVEIRKHAAAGYGKDAYFIPKGTPGKVFPGKAGAAAILQDAKNKLQSKGLLRVLRQGDPGHEAVVWLSTASVVLRSAGRGRPISSTAAPRVAHAPAPGVVLIDPRDLVRNNAARVAEYARLMEPIFREYADIFTSQFRPITYAVPDGPNRGRGVESADPLGTPTICHLEVR